VQYSESLNGIQLFAFQYSIDNKNC